MAFGKTKKVSEAGMGTGQSRESREFSVPGLESRDTSFAGQSRRYQSRSRLSRGYSVPVPGRGTRKSRDSAGFCVPWDSPAGLRQNKDNSFHRQKSSTTF